MVIILNISGLMDEELVRKDRMLNEDIRLAFIINDYKTAVEIFKQIKQDNKDINFAADRNPLKWNKKMPGSNIPIISEKSSRLKRPDYYLVLPWHFKDEFIS